MNINVVFESTSQEIKAGFSETGKTIDADFGEVQVVTEYVGGEPYEGSYDITPKSELQTLPTENRTMREDLKVRAIPFYDVSNNSGGSTVYIGTLDE